MTPKEKASIGRKYNMLTVLREVMPKSGRTMVLCKCDCGEEAVALLSKIKRGEKKSCGCLRLIRLREKCVTHQRGGTPEHIAWAAMIQRCTNPKEKSFKHYGGRGITVCDRWRKFENFFQDMGARPKGHSIDRIDNGEGYYKENCRWATPAAQNRNKRTNWNIAFNGETKCLKDWAEEVGIHWQTIRSRLTMGWPAERALTEPVRPINKRQRDKCGKFT